MTMLDSITSSCTGAARHDPDGKIIFDFKFSPEDSVFAGHFPGRPILPGVFQLEMARAAAASALNSRLTVREIRKAKFQRPIAPGEAVRLELELSSENGLIRARVDFSVNGQPAGEAILFLCRIE